MKKAFTLIELLVVIAIIAVLAAILFPVFAKARERALVTVCQSNLKQIGMAVGVYLVDWDQRYPWAYKGEIVKTQGKWPPVTEVLDSYVTDERICECPKDSGELFHRDLGHVLNYPTRRFYSKSMYFSSCAYLGEGWPDYLGKLSGYSASHVKKPTRAVLCVESRPWHGGYNQYENASLSKGLDNVLYCDGHIARRTRKAWGDDAMAGVTP